MPRGLRFSTAVHRTFSNNFRTRKNPISQARKRPGSYPILPPPRAIPNPIPTTPKPDLPVKNGDPGLKTGYFFTLSSGLEFQFFGQSGPFGLVGLGLDRGRDQVGTRSGPMGVARENFLWTAAQLHCGSFH